MTLDEMLALLPDNTVGDIGAGDMRAIVTDLYHMANDSHDSYAYKWESSGGAPAAGHVTMDQPWQTFATKARVSETTDDGVTLGFTIIDSAIAAKVWFTNSTGAKLVADVTGPSVDMGTYRDVPIHVTSITGAAPTNNSAVTVTLLAVLP